jgi:hypothetical protein
MIQCILGDTLLNSTAQTRGNKPMADHHSLPASNMPSTRDVTYCSYVPIGCSPSISTIYSR